MSSYTERMTEYQGEKRENAVNFIELNLMTAQTIDLIDPDGNTDTQKVEANLQQITQRINKLQPGTTSETQNAVREYQDSVKSLSQRLATISSSILPTAKHIHNYLLNITKWLAKQMS